ncbi:MAG TPA: hypothetical protein VJ978_01845 [Nitriliruptoraceae bacterium]|nr:hypothetical protein [Nitriliruptoraceae bacterium]
MQQSRTIRNGNGGGTTRWSKVIALGTVGAIALTGIVATSPAAAMANQEGATGQSVAQEVDLISEDLRAEAVATLEQRYPEFFGNGHRTTQTAASASVGAKAAWKIFYKTALKPGFTIVSDTVLADLFGGDDPADTPLQQMGDALAHVQASIIGLKADITALQTDVEKLLNATEWGQFQAADNHASGNANEIEASTALLGEELAVRTDGETPSAQTLSTIANGSYHQIFKINGHLFGDGTANPGSVALLHTALARELSSTSWVQIDVYRDRYLGAIAQAVVNLQAVADWDPGYATWATAAEKEAAAITASFEQVGASPRVEHRLAGGAMAATEADYLHINGQSEFFALGTRPTIAGESVSRFMGSDAHFGMEAELEALRDHHVATRTDGTTFEEYLESRNMPTWFMARDSHSKTWSTMSDGRLCAMQAHVHGDEIGGPNPNSPFRMNCLQPAEWDAELAHLGIESGHVTDLNTLKDAAMKVAPYRVRYVETNAYGFPTFSARDWNTRVVQGLPSLSVSRVSDGHWTVDHTTPGWLKTGHDAAAFSVNGAQHGPTAEVGDTSTSRTFTTTPKDAIVYQVGPRLEVDGRYAVAGVDSVLPLWQVPVPASATGTTRIDVTS